MMAFLRNAALFVAATAFFVAFLLFSALTIFAAQELARSDIKADAVVKVIVGKGHGSAVHIGNGVYLTAGHVAGALEEVGIKTSTGETGTAKVLWVSKDYDIALIKSDIETETANLECRAPEVGEHIQLKGNPLNLEFQTTWGRVSGTEVSVGPWEAALPVNAAIAGGMSGGGMFDADGDLIGINVGGMVQRIGFGGSMVGIGYIVPANAICGLLAR